MSRPTDGFSAMTSVLAIRSTIAKGLSPPVLSRVTWVPTTPAHRQRRRGLRTKQSRARAEMRDDPSPVSSRASRAAGHRDARRARRTGARLPPDRLPDLRPRPPPLPHALARDGARSRRRLRARANPYLEPRPLGGRLAAFPPAASPLHGEGRALPPAAGLDPPPGRRLPRPARRGRRRGDRDGGGALPRGPCGRGLPGGYAPPEGHRQAPDRATAYRRRADRADRGRPARAGRHIRHRPTGATRAGACRLRFPGPARRSPRRRSARGGRARHRPANERHPGARGAGVSRGRTPSVQGELLWSDASAPLPSRDDQTPVRAGASLLQIRP